jgi:DNA-binding NtrC family response regulator
MNILFIEDERELRESGVAQLELHQYTVYPVSNLAEAHAVMENPTMPVHLVLADQSLPDGQGIHFVIEMKTQFLDCQYAIVSGCLTDGNVSLLEEKEIPFFRKPLLYGRVVEEFRRAYLMKAPCRESAPEVPSDEVVVPSDEVVVPSEAEAAPCSEPEASKPKKWFGLFDK